MARTTYANVCSTLALVVALGTGTAYAANTVGSDDIIDESIQSQDIKNGQVKAADLGNNAVGTPELKPDSIDTTKVIANSLTAADLGTDSVGATEIADDSIDGGEIVNESLGAGELAANSVGASELAANAVTGGDVANNSLTTADVAGADALGSISLGAGSVANGRCRQFDATAGGAQPNEAVVMSTRGALQDGIVIYAQRIPSAGHVTVNVCNFSGTTQAAIVDLPTRIVTWG